MPITLVQVNMSNAKDLRKNLIKKSTISFISGSSISGSLDLNIKSTGIREERYKIGNILVTYSALSHADI